MPDMNPLDEAWRDYYRTKEKLNRRRNRVYLPLMVLGLVLWCVPVIGYTTFNGVALLGLLLMVIPGIGVAVDGHRIDRRLDDVRYEIDREAFLFYARMDQKEGD